MAHMLFDALNGVSLDNHTVQSILDSTALSTAGPPTTITLDEEDVFQCGKCKKQFTSFSRFMCHKKEHTAAADNCHDSECVESGSFQQLEVQALDNSMCASDLCQPIVLSEADILSFSIDDDDPLNITDPIQVASSVPNLPGENSFLVSNIDSGIKQLGGTTSNSLTNDFDVTALSSQPIVLASQLQQNSFSSSTLPCTESISSQSKLVSSHSVSGGKDTQNINVLASCPERHSVSCGKGPQNFNVLASCPERNSVSCGKGSQNINVLASYSESHSVSCGKGVQNFNVLASCPEGNSVSCGKGTQNINVLASCPERHPKGCKVLLPNIDYIEDNDDGPLLLECDKITDKFVQYGTGSIDCDGTVLLDYYDGDASNTCKVLLPNGEYAETSIEYIDTTDGICDYAGIAGIGENDAGVGHETVSVSLLDVIHSPDGSSVTLELSKAINEVVNTQEISVHEQNLSVSISPTKNSSVSEADPQSETVCPNASYDPNEASTNEKDNSRLSSAKFLKLKCHYCDKMFAKNFDLQQHLRSHTGEKPFQCVVCGRAFSQKSNVKKHLATHKVWPDGLSRTLPKEPLQVFEKCAGGNKKKNKGSDDGDNIIIIDRSYVCQYCNTPFSSYFELKTHMKNHSHQKVYKCVQHNCQKTFEDLDSFLRHTKVHTSEVQYCCHVCFKKFNSLADLGIHQYTHNPQNGADVKNTRYFLCMKCKSKFTSSKALDHHLSTTNHHFPCTHCGKVFTCERYLRRHLPTHGTPETYVCPTCGKGFRTEQYLNTHRLIHSGVKPYTCAHCPAAFNRKDKLARHILIHQAVKKFKCPFHNYLGCSKEFHRQDKLKLHILTHSAVKPFHCRKCNKMFHKQTQLREHERSHHSTDTPFSCARCGLRFKKKVHLSTHHCILDDIPEELIKFHDKPSAAVHIEDEATKITRGRRYRKILCKKPLSSPSKDVSNPEKETTEVIMPDVHISASRVDNAIEGDSVPTIEIIVMPMPVKRNESEEKKGVYHVMFPASSSDGEIQTKSVQSNALNNSSKTVPEGHNGQTAMACIRAIGETTGM